METKLKEFIDDMPVFLRDLDETIIYWTRGCEDLFGYSVEEALGQVSFELLATELPVSREAIDRVLANEREWSGRVRQSGKAGRHVWTQAVWRLCNRAESGAAIISEQHTDVTEQVAIEAQKALLSRELEHRVGNLLTVVQALARRSFPDATPEQSLTFEKRLFALAQANRLLREDAWKEADLATLIGEVVRPLGVEARLRSQGPEVTVSAEHATGLALSIHELCTNALKHGALSVEAGHVELTWDIDPADTRYADIHWSEHGGPRPLPPERTGFGMLLLRQAVRSQEEAPVQVRFEPEGVVCDLRILRARGS